LKHKHHFVEYASFSRDQRSTFNYDVFVFCFLFKFETESIHSSPGDNRRYHRLIRSGASPVRAEEGEKKISLSTTIIDFDVLDFFFSPNQRMAFFPSYSVDCTIDIFFIITLFVVVVVVLLLFIIIIIEIVIMIFVVSGCS